MSIIKNYLFQRIPVDPESSSCQILDSYNFVKSSYVSQVWKRKTKAGALGKTILKNTPFTDESGRETSLILKGRLGKVAYTQKNSEVLRKAIIPNYSKARETPFSMLIRVSEKCREYEMFKWMRRQRNAEGKRRIYFRSPQNPILERIAFLWTSAKEKYGTGPKS